jgi:hypothetical protein
MSEQRPNDANDERKRNEERNGNATRKFLFGKDQTPKQIAAVLRAEWDRQQTKDKDSQ